MCLNGLNKLRLCARYGYRRHVFLVVCAVGVMSPLTYSYLKGYDVHQTFKQLRSYVQILGGPSSFQWSAASSAGATNARRFSTSHDSTKFSWDQIKRTYTRCLANDRSCSQTEETEASSQAMDQTAINYIASKLDVQYNVIDNLVDTWKSYKGEIVLTNSGTETISLGPWAIYFSHIRIIEPKHFPYKDPRKNGYVLKEYGIKFTHVNGAMYKMEPVAGFKPLGPGDQLRIIFNGEFWTVAATDVMPNWYVAAEGLEPKTISSTAGESLNFVGSFDTQNQWKRHSDDRYNPYTAETRYATVDTEDLKEPGKLVVPTPVKVTVQGPGRVSLQGDWAVVADPGLENEAALLADQLGLRGSTVQPSNRYIKLALGDITVKVDGKDVSTCEAHAVDVNAEQEVIYIRGRGAAGVFLGGQTLVSLAQDSQGIPEISLQDAPRYGYRGMMIDVGRNFMKKEVVLRLIDAMAFYKLNKLHLHLTDDEGWRLEIPGLDELTSIGSRRCHDLKEKSCILSQLGSGPGTGNAGTGYYTTTEYREILRYATDRHIEVIPEFDAPGHGHAAIKAMEARYDKLMRLEDKAGAEKYLLSDPDDKSTYLSVQYFTDNGINPCIESTYNFMEHIVSTVVDLHKDISPLKTFNYGGDETAAGAWQKSPKCQEMKARVGNDTDLKLYFVNRVSDIAHKYGLDLAAWEDGLLTHPGDQPYDRSRMKSNNVYGYCWQNIWEWGVGNRAYKLANAGYKVVMAQATSLYFDHPHEPDPADRGYYWAPRYIDTHRTFSFMPDDLYENADFKRSGEPISKEWLCKHEGWCVPLLKPENIVGVQAQLWAETVRSTEQFWGMIFPRLVAAAERAWHKAAWEFETDKSIREQKKEKDWSEFANALGYRELARLDKLGVTYTIPPPGAKIVNGELVVNSAFPGLVVQYSKDGGAAWRDWAPGTVVRGVVHLVTRSADRSRRSRVVVFDTSKAGGVAVDCSVSPDGFYPHPLDCSKFFQCAGKQRYGWDCPTGLVYNPNISTCDWPVNYACPAQ